MVRIISTNPPKEELRLASFCGVASPSRKMEKRNIAGTPNLPTPRVFQAKNALKANGLQEASSPGGHEIVTKWILPHVEEPCLVLTAHISFPQEHAAMSNNRLESAMSNIGYRHSGM